MKHPSSGARAPEPPEQRNLKFWFFATRGWVRLTLRPGQTISWGWHGPTEEGWHGETVTWMRDGARVLREWDSHGCDCDGRLSTHSECEWDGETLVPCNAVPGSPLVPDWVRRPYPHSSRRDYSAEAAGY